MEKRCLCSDRSCLTEHQYCLARTGLCLVPYLTCSYWQILLSRSPVGAGKFHRALALWHWLCSNWGRGCHLLGFSCNLSSATCKAKTPLQQAHSSKQLHVATALCDSFPSILLIRIKIQVQSIHYSSQPSQQHTIAQFLLMLSIIHNLLKHLPHTLRFPKTKYSRYKASFHILCSSLFSALFIDLADAAVADASLKSIILKLMLPYYCITLKFRKAQTSTK